MKKSGLWLTLGLLAFIIVLALAFWMKVLDRKLGEAIVPLVQKQRGIVLTDYLQKDLQKLGIGGDQEYWSAFYLSENESDFPWMKSKIMDQSGFPVGGVNLIYKFGEGALNPRSVECKVWIFADRLKEVASGPGELGKLVTHILEEGKSPLVSKESIGPDGELEFEIEYPLNEKGAKIQSEAYGTYFDKTVPTLISTVSLVAGVRPTDILTEANFVLGDDGHYVSDRRYVLMFDKPHPPYLARVRPGKDDRFELGVRPIFESFSPEKGLKYWKEQKDDTVIYALEEYRSKSKSGVFRFLEETGEMVTDIDPHRLTGK